MDAAGNESADSTARIFTLDTSAPAQSVVISSVSDNVNALGAAGPTVALSNGDSTNDPTPTLSGTLSAGLATGEVLRVFSNGTALGNATVATTTAGFSWSFTPATALATSSANPTYTLTAAVIDAAGNTGAASSPWTLTLDTVAPLQTVGITDILDGDASDFLGRTGSVTAAGTTNDTTPTVIGTLSAALAAGENVLVYRDASATTLLGTASIGTNGVSWSFTPTTTLSTNGVYTLSARVVDAAGLLGPIISATRLFTLDTTAPTQTSTITNLVDDVFLNTGAITAGGLSNDSTPTLSGSLSAALATGEILQVFANGTYRGTASVTTTNWTFVTPSLAADGATTFTTRVVDAAGNSGAESSSRSFVLDTSLTSGQTVSITDLVDDFGLVTGSISAGGVSNDTTPTLRGTLAVALAADETLKVFNGTALLGTATVASDLSWSLTSPTLSTNSAYTFSARVIDTAGNQGTSSNTRGFSLDTVAPTLTAPIGNVIDNLGSTTGSITAGGFSDDTTPTLSGSISAAIGATDSVGIYVNGVYRGNTVPAALTAGSSWSFSFETAGITLPGNATYTFTTRVLDAFGNEGTASGARVYNLLDSSAPSQTITISDLRDNVDLYTGSISAGGLTNDTTPTLIGSLSAALGLGETLQIRNGTAVLGSASVASDLSWSYTPSTALAGGNGVAYTLTAKIVDSAGYSGSSIVTRSFTLDNAAPNPTVAPAAPSVTISNVIDDVGSSTGAITAAGFSDDTTPTLSGTLSTALGSGDTLKVFANNDLLGDVSFSSSTAWTLTPATPLTANTIYTFTVAVVDAAGNKGTGAAAPTRVYNLLDSIAPDETVTIVDINDNVTLYTGLISDGGLSNDATPTLSGTLSAGLGLGESLQIRNGATVLGNAVVTTSGSSFNWTYTPATSLTVQGSYSFSARVVDAAGYAGPSSNTRNLVLDTIAPTITTTLTSVTDSVGSVTGNVAANGFTDDTTPTLAGTLSAALGSGETLQVLRNGVFDGFATISTSGSTYNWNYTSTLTGAATYTFTAAVYDPAGNPGGTPATRILTLGATQSISFSQVFDNVGSNSGVVAEAGSSNDPTPTLSGTLSAPLASGNTVRVYDNGSQIAVNATIATVSGVINWTYTPTLTTNGSHSFTAAVVDSGSNPWLMSPARSMTLSAPVAANSTNTFVDSLTGTTNTDDRFQWANLAAARMNGTTGARTVDTITNFESIDGLQISGTNYNTTLTSSVGNATNLDSLTTLLSSTLLPINTARAFTVTGYSGTFVAFNNSAAGFDYTTDGVVFLQNYNLSASNPISVI